MGDFFTTDNCFYIFQEFDHPSEDIENTIPESSLISLLKKLEEELEIQDIPMAPIVVYLEDKDTHAIMGIKVREEIHMRNIT